MKLILVSFILSSWLSAVDLAKDVPTGIQSFGEKCRFRTLSQCHSYLVRTASITYLCVRQTNDPGTKVLDKNRIPVTRFMEG